MNLFRRRIRGYVLILVALTVPVIMLAVNYAVKRVQWSHKSTVKTSTSFAVGHAALEKYNPGKTWDAQKAKVYSAAVQALCDRAFELNRDMILTPSSIKVYHLQKNLTTDISSIVVDHAFNLTKAYLALSSFGFYNTTSSNKTFFQEYAVNSSPITTSNSLFCDDFPVVDMIFNSSNKQLSFKLCTTSSSSATEAYETVYVDPALSANTSKLNLTLDTTNNCINCVVAHLGKTVKAYPARCDVDIVLTLPTNHAACTSNNSNSSEFQTPDSATSTPIVQVARAYQVFLKHHFLHTHGVSVGVVPYSAKISIPPNRGDWTVGIPPMTSGTSTLTAAVPNPPYIKQAVAYGSDGQAGGNISGTSVFYSWGNGNVGYPIMFRCGIIEQYRSVNLYRGSASTAIPATNNNLLISTENPATAVSGAYPYKFLRMNPNPCYLGHCNILAGMCEKTCPTFMANPYFITELTDDLEKVIYDFSLIRPINDTHNKSNFLFLAVQWAQNLLSSWTAFPSTAVSANQKFSHPTRANKKHAVIFVVNAPDNFEPIELTYLGFNNDASEIPMFESDTIDFGYNYGSPTSDPLTSPVKGTKGALIYTGPGVYNSAQSGYVVASGTGKLTFSQKGILRIVVKSMPSSVTFYNDNQVSDCKVGSTAVTLGSAYTLSGPTTFTFSGPTKDMWNWAHNSVSLSGNATTGGVNFGHNLSLYKVKYALNSASITSATLSNQILRCYAHYGYGHNPAPKTIILNNDHAETVTSASPEQYMDPCIAPNGNSKYNQSDGWVYGSTGSPQFAQIMAYSFHPRCYGIQKGKFLMTARWDATNVSADNATMSTSGGWRSLGSIANDNKYSVFNLLDNPSESDKVFVFTGRFTYKSKEEFDKFKLKSCMTCVANPSLHCNQNDSKCIDGYGNIAYLRNSWSAEPASGWQLVSRDGDYYEFTGGEKSCIIKYDYSGEIIENTCYSTYKLGSSGCVQSVTIDTEVLKQQATKVSYDIFRYDLNNFFFVNLETKSYNASASLDDIKKNKYIGTIQSGGANWLAFCGDGKLEVAVSPNYGTFKFTNINNLSGAQTGAQIGFGNSTFNAFTNNTSYPVTGTQTFYLVPEQIKDKDSNDNYYVNFDISNLTLISAEITNRPYETTTPSVKMYEGTAEKTSIDCAASDDGKTSKTVTFKTNVKAAFRVQAKVPYAWVSGTVDFRQTSAIGTVYCNSNSHSFRVNVAVPSSSTDIVSVNPSNTLNTTTNSNSIVITARRKLSAFTLGGNYYYVSQKNYKANVYNFTNEKYQDDTKWCPNCGGGGGCTFLGSYFCCADFNGNCAYDSSCYNSTPPDGFHSIGQDHYWSYTDYALVTCPTGSYWVHHYKRTSSCTKWYNPNCVHCEAFYSTCPGDGALSETGHTYNIVCSESYNNLGTRTNNECANKSSMDMSEIRNANAYIRSPAISGLSAGNWGGSFDAYTYTVTNVDANVRDLAISTSGRTQIYSNGSFGGATVNYNSNSNTGLLTATTADGNRYKYTSATTNCTISMASRTKNNGTISRTSGSDTVNAQESTAMTSVPIDPATHTFTPDGLGNYTVTVTCTNVVVSDPTMVSTTPIMRYTHPDIVAAELENVRIVDFNKNENSRPKAYGSVVFGSSTSGNLDNKIYDNYQHLKYWITTGNGNHLYRTDSDVYGDYFMLVMDVDGNIPGIEWFFPHEATSGNIKNGYGNGFFGTYDGLYSFSGLHRVFFPWGEQEYHSSYGAKVDLISGGKMAFFLGGFTLPVNHALQNNGFQTTSGTLNSTLNTTPNAAVAAVTAAACNKFKADFPATNTKVYVIRYGTNTPTTLNACGNGTVNVYTASSESDLVARLHQIAEDIKSWAQYSDARVE